MQNEARHALRWRPPTRAVWPALWTLALLTPAAALGSVAESEPNDSAAAAQDLTGAVPLATSFPPEGAGVLVTGAISPGDVDVFAFAVQAGDFITAEVLTDDAGEFDDSLLRLVTDAGPRDDDDGGAGFLSSVSAEASSAGTWQVVVTGFGDEDFDGSGHEEDFAYRLALSVSPAATGPLLQETESNDATALADPVPTTSPFLVAAPGGVAVGGGSLQPGDVDHWKIDAEQPGALSVAVYDDEGGVFHDPLLRVTPPGGSAAEDDDGGPGFQSTKDQSDAAAGVWDVVVTGFGDGDFDGAGHTEDFSYRLVVSYEPTAEERCDVDADGDVDVDDIDAITAALGQPAAGPDDPRDADADGQITVLDARECTFQCDEPECARPTPKTVCGLLGIEMLVVAPLFLRRVRRRTRHGL